MFGVFVLREIAHGVGFDALLRRIRCRRVDCKLGIDYHSFVLCEVLAWFAVAGCELL